MGGGLGVFIFPQNIDGIYNSLDSHGILHTTSILFLFKRSSIERKLKKMPENLNAVPSIVVNQPLMKWFIRFTQVPFELFLIIDK